MIPKDIQDLGQRLSSVVQAEIPEGAFVLLCVFVPQETEGQYTAILRVNVEEPEQLFQETERMIANARATEVVDLRDVVEGMQ